MVVESIGEVTVNSVEELEEAMKNVKPGDALRVRVRHGIWEMAVWVPTRK